MEIRPRMLLNSLYRYKEDSSACGCLTEAFSPSHLPKGFQGKSGQQSALSPALPAALARHQDIFQARLEIVFALGPQSHPVHGNSLLDLSHPIQQFTNVLACFFLVPLQIFGPSHHFDKSGLLGTLRRRPAFPMDS